MYILEEIRTEILKLYKTKPLIHIDASFASPKLSLKNARAKITGVYPHLFQLEVDEGENKIRRHTFQYSDVLVSQVIISELQKQSEE